MSFLENLNWRYATKEFDGRKIPADVLEKILEAIRLAPTSFGLQPFHVTVVENDDLKQSLAKHSPWNAKQFTTSSHLLVFSADLDVKKRAQDFVALAVKQGLAQFADTTKFDYVKATTGLAERLGGAEWVARQAYIALGFALAACAELKIDSCPMEGADLAGIKQTLALPKNLDPKVVLAVGYRSPNDHHASEPKFRFGTEELFDRKGM